MFYWQLIILAIEAVIQRCSVEKVFLEIWQNSKENTCVRVSFLISCRRPATWLKKRLWHRCFPVNFAKFLRTPFLIEHLRWLLLYSQKMFCESLLQRDFPLKSHHEMFLKFFWTVTFKNSSKWRLLDKVFWNLLIKLLKESQPYDSALT